jgi:hypothetical protein
MFSIEFPVECSVNSSLDLQNGDLFLQVRDILLHALASARKDLEQQAASCGIELSPEYHKILLKRAQFLLYTCRHAQHPTQVCVSDLHLYQERMP